MISMIQLRKVRVNNLKEVDLDIPHGQWLVFCGLSGSGKTSLALDTLYAEGQRRYIESLSPSTRQFLQQLGKPDADRIDGIPPAIAVQATKSKPGPRATVGTATETIEYLRLLFSKIAHVRCPGCESEIKKHNPQSVTEKLECLPEKTRFQIVFDATADQDLTTNISIARKNGFARAIVGSRTLDLDSPGEYAEDERAWVVVDRLAAGSSSADRIRDSLETAFDFGNGLCRALVLDDAAAELETDLNTDEPVTIDGKTWQLFSFSSKLICPNCNRDFPAAQPKLFSFNSPLGACAECEGFGAVQRLDMDLIVPEPAKSLSEGAIAPWRTKAYIHELEELTALADDYSIPMDVPFRELTEEQIQLLWDGVPEREFGGLTGFFEWLEKRRYKMHIRVFLSRWKKFDECSSCEGRRLNLEALAFRIGAESNQSAESARMGACNLAEISQMKVDDAIHFLHELKLNDWQQAVANKVLKQVLSRFEYLSAAGLGYLTLDRTMRTLSGGEAQRVQLTSTLSSTLVNMLYVLDEPSVGLHPHDIQRLTDAIGGLSRRGNTVVVVDHEPTIIQSAERIVEIGPAAGVTGGEVVFDGSLKEMLDSEQSLTGAYLSGRRGLSPEMVTRRSAKARMKLTGASGNNLKNIDVEFPLGCLCLVTGVSGSGKSSLVQETLYGALCRRKGQTCDTPLPYMDMFGDGQIEEVLLVDQSPIGRSPRSNPVTYIKVFDEIRKIFASTMDAKTRNMKPGHFSFNVDGGRCDKCSGDGHLAVDMQFLADVYMKCDQCQGTRYREEVLTVKHRSKNIAQVLQLTVREAFSFFRGHPKVQAKLKALIDVGLEYIRLGQPATTLSSGEAQRLKLALYLNNSKRARTLFILDEPTTGLHMKDVVQLLDCFDALLAVGHSLIVVEHNLQLIRHADWIIDMGPGAADLGGTVVVAGTPEEVAGCGQSVTGKYLQ